MLGIASMTVIATIVARISKQAWVPLLFLASVLPAGAQTSSWWYPLGTPEGTRSNPVQADTQSASDLQIKWRNHALKNSPVILVGKIRPDEAPNARQVVGISEGEEKITILKGNGFLDTEFPISSTIPIERLVLTGLFDTTLSPNPLRPQLIGLGIEREFTDMRPANGWLLDQNGVVRYQLGILASDEQTSVPLRNKLSNRILSILPFTLIRTSEGLIAFSIVTQDQFGENGSSSGSEQMINSVRGYLLKNPGDVTAFGEPIYITPRLYPQVPAVAEISGTNYYAFSTNRYAFTPPIARQNPATSSGTAHALSYRTITGGLELVDNDSSVAAATLTSQIARLQGELVQVMAEQGTPQAKIRLDRLIQGDSISIFTGNSTTTGWEIVIADVDGNNANGTNHLVRNPGNEVIATGLPQVPGDEGTVYLMRLNNSASKPDGQTSSFHYFAKQKIRGKIVAAGHLVQEPEHAMELLLANDDNLSILRLKQYTSGAEFEADRPLETLKTFTLDSKIISVAIADLDEDGKNDIIVSTLQSTYAIGKILPDPYPITGNVIGKKTCIDDTIHLRWEQKTYGSGSGLRAEIIGPDGFLVTLPSDSIVDNSLDVQASSGLNITQAGSYQLRVTDSEFGHISQLSETFHIAVPTLGDFVFDEAGSVSPGDILIDTIASCCIKPENIILEQELGGSGSWNGLPGSLEPRDTFIVVRTTVPCPGIEGCDDIDDGGSLQYRLKTNQLGIISSNVLRIIPPRAEGVTIEAPDDPSGEGRSRTLIWEASEFPCDSLVVSIGNVGENNWQEIGTFATSSQFLEFEVPSGYIDSLRLCLRCLDPLECTFGATSFKVNRVTGAYVAPNPFDPEGAVAGGEGAVIVYALQESGGVSITIYDGAWNIVRKIVDGEERGIGRNRDFWDGTNSLGEIVANGTYICVISSGAGEQIILPIAIVKKQ